MKKFVLRCVLCKSIFPSFERYEEHVVSNHRDRLDLRMKPEIVRAD
jgi:hypothetical protein